MVKQTIEQKIAEMEKTIAKYPNGNITPTLKKAVELLKKEIGK